MNKKTKSAFLVYAIILAVYLVLFFVIPFPKGAVAWISFVFTIIAIVGGAGITYYAFSKGNDLKTKVYGFPVFRMGFVYSAVQLMLNLKKQLAKLAEKFRYSDPVSCDELTAIEDQLKCEVKELESLVNTDVAAATNKAQSIEILLADRNRRCKEYK